MRNTLLFFVFLFSFSGLIQAEDLDRYFASNGLVDVMTMDTSIKVSLIYATPDNFIGEAVYSGITGIWLHPHAAQRLTTAAQLLKKEHPEYSLIVYDAARPMSVQRKMWNLVRGTDKRNYVSNPANGGGLHNYGMAVDITILDENEQPLPMGTIVDYFGEEAHINNEETLVRNGQISQEELQNRLLLRRIMRQAGFRTILYEWWHFNACSRDEARQNYQLIE